MNLTAPMKVILATAMTVVACPKVSAWVTPWNYNDLMEVRNHAELIVIATPVSTAEIGDVIPLTGEPNPWMGVGLETTFKIETELKGMVSSTKFVLHHYRYQSPHEGTIGGRPSLVSFKSNDQGRYLLFLKKDADGRYVPATDQSNAGEAVFVLAEYSSPLPGHPSWDLLALIMTALIPVGVGIFIANRKAKAPK
jgi:hypothetical protein